MRERLLSRRREQAKEHADRAEKELEAGRHGTAATLFRLAHEHDPDNQDYANRWRESLSVARSLRAELRFKEGMEAKRAGRIADAARAFSEAADADPSLRHLAEAAELQARVDPGQARSYALQALEALQQARVNPSEAELDERLVVAVHMACAQAFLAAGQNASAKEQAEHAHALAPSERTRTLLNSIKLT